MKRKKWGRTLDESAGWSYTLVWHVVLFYLFVFGERMCKWGWGVGKGQKAREGVLNWLHIQYGARYRAQSHDTEIVT